MKKLAAVAAFVCIGSTAAGAADYEYLNGKTDTRLRSELLALLAKNRSDSANVSIGITRDGDIDCPFELWTRQTGHHWPLRAWLPCANAFCAVTGRRPKCESSFFANIRFVVRQDFPRSVELE